MMDETVSSIDISFDVHTDTPAGKDPDTFSPTLRRYHKTLWSKPLPNGAHFELDLTVPKYLHHKSAFGEFVLASDAIGHTYSRWKRTAHIVAQFPPEGISRPTSAPPSARPRGSHWVGPETVFSPCATEEGKANPVQKHS